MCTATFIKDKSGRITFTTNRDENAARPTAQPKIHEINGQKLLFPQDLLAGGTWVAVNENGLLCCILNGAKGEHSWLGTKAEKSRGQVLLEAFQYPSVEDYFSEKEMENAHPFTLLWISPDADDIGEIRWNGKEKWLSKVRTNQPHIWSSHTLYPEEQRLRREARFHALMTDEKYHNPEAVWEIHQSSKSENGLLLENSPHVNTVSTTQVIIDPQSAQMSYYQMDQGLRFVDELGIS